MGKDYRELVLAIREQTKAINQLVITNRQVIGLLTDVVASMHDEHDPDADLDTDLDGNSL